MSETTNDNALLHWTQGMAREVAERVARRFTSDADAATVAEEVLAAFVAERRAELAATWAALCAPTLGATAWVNGRRVTVRKVQTVSETLRGRKYGVRCDDGGTYDVRPFDDDVERRMFGAPDDVPLLAVSGRWPTPQGDLSFELEGEYREMDRFTP